MNLSKRARQHLSLYLGSYESETRAKEVYAAAKLLMHPGFVPHYLGQAF